MENRCLACTGNKCLQQTLLVFQVKIAVRQSMTLKICFLPVSLKRQVRWSGIPISFRIFHSLLCSTQSKALAQSIKHSLMSNSATLWTAGLQAPLSVEFSRQEYGSRLPFPASGDLSIPGIEPASLASSALAGGFFTTELPGKSHFQGY